MPSSDPPRELQPTGVDLGTLFRDVQKLTAPEEYPYSFLSGRFRDLDGFQAAAGS